MASVGPRDENTPDSVNRIASRNISRVTFSLPPTRHGSISSVESSSARAGSEASPVSPQHAHTQTSSAFGERAFRQGAGLSWRMAAVLITGEMAGCGMLVLSYALTKCGFVGGLLVSALAVVAGYCGFCLAHCWLIVEKRHPQLAVQRSRAPYPEIAAEAFGAAGACVTTLVLVVSTFGCCIVYITLMAQLATGLLEAWPLTYCHWTVLVSLLVVPLSWVGSAADLCWVGVFSLLTSAATCLLLIIQLSLHFDQLQAEARFPAPTALGAFGALGPILFAYGGAVAFPNIQNDMKDRKNFDKSIFCGFLGLGIMYLPLSMLGYAALGIHQKPNLIDTLQLKAGGALVSACQVLFIGHLSTAFFVVMNPFFLQMEDIANIPDQCGIIRVIFRSIIMITQTFLALLIPDFIRIIDIIGLSAIAAASFILPPIFRLKLLNDKPPPEIIEFYASGDATSNNNGLGERIQPEIPGWNEPPLHWWERTILLVIPMIGIFLALFATIRTIQDIAKTGLNTASCLLSSAGSSLWRGRA